MVARDAHKCRTIGRKYARSEALYDSEYHTDSVILCRHDTYDTLKTLFSVYLGYHHAAEAAWNRVKSMIFSIKRPRVSSSTSLARYLISHVVCIV
jgi:hypothetical protein